MLTLTAVWLAAAPAGAQGAPAGHGLAPFAPPTVIAGPQSAADNVPTPSVPVAEPTGAPNVGLAPATERRPRPFVLFASEGLDSLLSLSDLRTKLMEALGCELISLADPRAPRADATVWAALGDGVVVLRVTPPHGRQVFRRVARDLLSADPALALSRVVLEMFWADSFARLDAAEIQDPFCSPGLTCVEAQRGAPWPPYPEVEVLDPWDTSYQRSYGWDPFFYRYPASAALTAPRPGRDVRAQNAYSDARYVQPAAVPEPRVPEGYALNLLIGGGVHGAGAVLRYEADLVRRFQSFDFGLAFIAGRGQPEHVSKARRAIAAIFQRRYEVQAFELDLGGSFGTFFATFDSEKAEVRPYLRGSVTFALKGNGTFDLLVQSDLATTFINVPNTGAAEYSLSFGLRHRL